MGKCLNISLPFFTQQTPKTSPYRLTDEDKELEELSPEDLAETTTTTTTTTTTEKAYYPGKLPLLLG